MEPGDPRGPLGPFMVTITFRRRAAGRPGDDSHRFVAVGVSLTSGYCSHPSPYCTARARQDPRSTGSLSGPRQVYAIAADFA